MDREGRIRWLVAAVCVAAITWLILFARGNEERRRADVAPPVTASVAAGWVPEGGTW